MVIKIWSSQNHKKVNFIFLNNNIVFDVLFSFIPNLTCSLRAQYAIYICMHKYIYTYIYIYAYIIYTS